MTALLSADEAARLRVGEQLVIMRAGDRDTFGTPYGQRLVTYRPPQAWVALSGPCPTCRGSGHVESPWGGPEESACTECLGRGRRIVPIYAECPPDCWCDGLSSRLIGRGTVEVLPVLHWSDNDEEAPPCISVGHTSPPGANSYLCLQRFGGHPLNLDPLPVPGRDWAILIDCTEVA